MIGRQFTLANSLPELTYKKLDRMLMDTEWKSKYRMVYVCALARIEALSDHTTILLKTVTVKPHGKHQFNLTLDD